MASSTSRPLLPNVDGQRPRVHVAPADISLTDGDLAGAFASSYGLTPDPWQRFVLDDWLAVKDGRWASMKCGLAVPRQNGKNALIEIRELYGAVGLGERILHTAHEVKTHLKHFRRMKHFFGEKANDPGARYPELNALVEHVRHVNGQEAIILTNGGSIEFIARSKNSGRGFTIDVLVMDEAQEMAEDELEALVPTTSAAPSGNPQWVFTGTPPGPAANGEVFTRIRREALGDSPGRAAWHEWSVADVDDLDNRELWRLTNPALESGRLQIEVIEGERSTFSDGGFARERLGYWAEEGSGDRAISEGEWLASGVDVAPADGLRVFTVAFNLDGTRLSLAGGLKHDHGVHAELIDSAEGDIASGLGALADWLAARWRSAAQIVLSGAAGAPVLAQLLKDRQVPDAVVKIATTQEYTTACSVTLDAVRASAAVAKANAELDEEAPLPFTHLSSEGQKQLDDSVAVADKKLRGTSGAWGWIATTDDGDETPIEAVSLAYWLATTTRRKPYGEKERRARFL